MTLDYILAGAVTAFLLGYLVYALDPPRALLEPAFDGIGSGARLCLAVRLIGKTISHFRTRSKERRS